MTEYIFYCRCGRKVTIDHYPKKGEIVQCTCGRQWIFKVHRYRVKGHFTLLKDVK